MSPKLDPKGIKEIKKITGKFLYNSRRVDITIAHALDELKSSIRNRRNQESIAPPYGLFSYKSRCTNHLQSQWHATGYRFRCSILECTKIKEQSWRISFPGKLGREIIQWTYLHPSQDHQSSHVIGGGGRGGITILRCTTSNHKHCHIGRTRSSTESSSSTNR